MCWFLKINPFYTAKVNQISWFLLDNFYKIFHRKEAATDMLSINTGTLWRLDSPDELMEGWFICDHVASLGCLFLIFTLFADHLPLLLLPILKPIVLS